MQALPIAHLSSKGQIVIPKGIRHSQQWANGQAFTVEETAEGILLRPVKQRVFPKTTLEQTAGCLKQAYSGPTKTLEDMDTAIRQGIEEQYGRR
jgi:AbrB family looped-hinge helix DNA binding protein